MDNCHAVVWIDHKNAHVIKFNRTQQNGEIVRHNSAPGNIHHKRGTMGSGHVYEDDQYLQEVADALRDAGPVLIVGPSQAKWRLKAFLGLREPAISKRVTAVEALDHPTDAEILDLARKFFAGNDRVKVTRH